MGGVFNIIQRHVTFNFVTST